MKIYFATSISGTQNPDSVKTNIEFINYLKNFGEVLSEHFANPELIGKGETELSNRKIHDRDMNWLFSSDVIVAEVSNVSLGVGYEIGRAVEHKKKILCLRKKFPSRLSAMISGCKEITLFEYSSLEEAKSFINNFLKQV